MTLAEFQPHVERAVTAIEWSIARSRRSRALSEERDAIEKALPLAAQYGIEREPLEARLDQIAQEMRMDVTADYVTVLPLRSVPMDMIAVAVARRVLKLPPEFPILSVKMLPNQEAIESAVMDLALRWQTPNAQTA